jgi:hypothetical protein
MADKMKQGARLVMDLVAERGVKVSYSAALAAFRDARVAEYVPDNKLFQAKRAELAAAALLELRS